MKLSSNYVYNFPHNLLLTNIELSKLRKALENGSAANIELSKALLHKIRKLSEFLGWHLGLLLKTGLALKGNVLKPLAKSVLIPLGLKVTASATDATILKKIFGSDTTLLTVLSEEMNGIMKTVKSLEESRLLIKGVTQTIIIEEKEQKVGFLGMLVATLGASLLEN